MVRAATTAHPMCVCGKLKRSYCTRKWVESAWSPYGFPIELAWSWVECNEQYERSECPMHGKAAR